MGSTALTLAADAYAQAKVDQELSSFSMDPFPYNIAVSLFNTVIREMNRVAYYSFCEDFYQLIYAPGQSTWDLMALDQIDPKSIIRLRRELSLYEGELTQTNFRQFQQFYRMSTPQTACPQNWAKYNSTIYLDTIPDQDYEIGVYYFQDIPLVTTETSTLPIPVSDEDVIIEGIYAYLCQRLGRPDFQEAYQLFRAKVGQVATIMKQDAGLPTQMPAAF